MQPYVSASKEYDPRMTELAYHIKDVHLSLNAATGPIDILKGITLEIEKGSSLGLIGPSGSGKSSLLMVLGGLEQATSGTVTALSKDITKLNEDALAQFRRHNMGVVFQSFHLIPTMTALENVATPLELAGDRDAFDKAATQLAAVGLDHRAGHYPSQLSGGEQQRVALARATVTQPKILLADEPTGNLDGKTGDEIIDHLFALQNKHGSTLVLVTHSQSLAARCDRVVRLRDGRLDHV